VLSQQADPELDKYEVEYRKALASLDRLATP